MHWWYFPDSYDEIIEQDDAPEVIEPDKKPEGRRLADFTFKPAPAASVAFP